MSDDTLRQELASIVHQLRRTIERESRTGGGELLANAARPKAARGAAPSGANAPKVGKSIASVLPPQFS